MTSFGTNHALIVGINEYGNGISQLRTAKADAERLASILGNPTTHGYEVHTLLDAQAKLKTLLDVIADLRAGKLAGKTIQEDDRLLLYFAGHGKVVEKSPAPPEGYLIPQDAVPTDVSTFLAMSDLRGAVAMTPCHHVLLILDCCHAGAFQMSLTREVSHPPFLSNALYMRFTTHPARQLIVSAAAGQTAFDMLAYSDDRGDDGTGHSPFAAALFEALAGKADRMPPPERPGEPPGDGIITATEIYMWVRDRVERRTAMGSTLQTPGLWPLEGHDCGEYVFDNPLFAGRTALVDVATVDDGTSPYRGLLAFTAKDKDLFFGRAALTQKLCRAVGEQPLTIVIGPSGCGKSSLVQAGLLPALASSGANRVIGPLRPGSAPFASLAGAWTESVGGPAIRDLPELLRAVEAHRSATNEELLFVIDQLEELVTLAPGQQSSTTLRSFAEALSELATCPGTRIVATLRSDFEPLFAESALAERWREAVFLMEPMTREGLLEAIINPANRKLLVLEPRDEIDRIVDQVKDEPGPLPLLSFWLDEVYRAYRERIRTKDDDRVLRLRGTRAGDIIGSIARALEAEFQSLVAGNPKLEATAMRVMLRMVAGTFDEPARRRVALHEFKSPDPEEQARIDQVVGRLSDPSVRLLVKGTVNGEPCVEPAHDAVVRSWSRLLDWWAGHRAEIAVQRDVAAADATYRREPRWLERWHTSPRLVQAERLARDGWLSVREAEFVHKSRSLRRLLLGASLAAALAVVAILGAAAGYAVTQQREADARVTVAQKSERSAQARQGEAERKARDAESRAADANAAEVASRKRVSELEADVKKKQEEARSAGERASKNEKVAQARMRDVERTGALMNARSLFQLGRELEALRMAVDEAHKVAFDPGADPEVTALARGSLLQMGQSITQHDRLPLPAGASRVAVSPDGETVAVGIIDFTMGKDEFDQPMRKEGRRILYYTSRGGQASPPTEGASRPIWFEDSLRWPGSDTERKALEVIKAHLSSSGLLRSAQGVAVERWVDRPRIAVAIGGKLTVSQWDGDDFKSQWECEEEALRPTAVNGGVVLSFVPDSDALAVFVNERSFFIGSDCQLVALQTYVGISKYVLSKSGGIVLAGGGGGIDVFSRDLSPSKSSWKYARSLRGFFSATDFDTASGDRLFSIDEGYLVIHDFRAVARMARIDVYDVCLPASPSARRSVRPKVFHAREDGSLEVIAECQYFEDGDATSIVTFRSVWDPERRQAEGERVPYLAPSMPDPRGKRVPLTALPESASSGPVGLGPEGRTIAVGQSEGVCLFQAGPQGRWSAGPCLREEGTSNAPIRKIVFDPTGQALVVARYDGTVQMWRRSEGRWVSSFVIRDIARAVQSAVLGRRGRTLATLSMHDEVVLWSGAGREVAELRLPEEAASQNASLRAF